MHDLKYSDNAVLKAIEQVLQQAEYRAWFWLLGVFLIALGPNLANGAVLWWEAANAFGFVAFAGLLILLTNGYRKSGFSHFHRWFGIAVFTAMILHALWFLIADSAVLEYVLPGAPVYMVAGLSAFAITILLTISSLKRPRKTAYTNSASFRFWHNCQSAAIVVFSALHIGLSSFYLVSYWQWVGLTLLCILSFVLPGQSTTAKRAERQQSMRELSILLAMCVCALILFVVLRAWV